MYDIDEISLCHVAFVPCLEYVKTTGLHVEDSYSQLSPASKTAVDSLLLWAKCLRDAGEVMDWGDRDVDLPENSNLFWTVAHGAFELYVSHQLSAATTSPRLCCQNRTSLFVSSVTPVALMDDSVFSIAATSRCGGWMMVDGGPACRQNVEMLSMVLDGDDNELDFLAHVDGDLLRKHPLVLERHPYVLNYLPALRKDADLFEKLVALDVVLLEMASRTIWEDGRVVAAAATRVARELQEKGHVAAELDRASAALLGRASLNSRLRRLTSDLAHCLIHSNEQGALCAASRIVQYCNRGTAAPEPYESASSRPSSYRKEDLPSAVVVPRCLLESSPIDEEVRLANEAARVVKLAYKKWPTGSGKSKTKSRKTKDAECSPTVEASSPKDSFSEFPRATKSLAPLVLSTKALECEETEAAKACRKKERRIAKKNRVRDEKIARRTQVAELFGLLSPDQT
jgi:hypothetical protein